MIETYGRVDFIVDDDDGVAYCLEANTLPGMTPTSLMPRMAEEMGMDFGGLCEKIVEVSLQKYGINL
jgi:D-alanine-D-alanine ligase